MIFALCMGDSQQGHKDSCYANGKKKLPVCGNAGGDEAKLCALTIRRGDNKQPIIIYGVTEEQAAVLIRIFH